MIARYYPPFTWYNNADGKSEIYDIDLAFDTFKIMKQRRGQEFTEQDEKMLKDIFDATKQIREKLK